MTAAPAPRLVLICGLPGSGKTTLARQLEGDLPALRLCGYEWMTQLQIDLCDEEARNRIERLFWGLAQRTLFLGRSAILESSFWLRSDRDEKRLGARAIGASVELHVPDVPLSERWHRIKMRNAKCEMRNTQGVIGAVPIRRDQLAEWDAYFEAPTSDEFAWFDPF